ncbi:hypothetical protein GCM10022222_05930 [Amycolatopsis ultiminotia]|uniref:Uncharacterized protein n=1 Tax=Amycolatopsis ultiminotia TaxID=543629 RepID=A0ABP6V0D0_9PSEU
MEPTERPPADAVLAAWAPAGMGRIVVVLGRGVVIHQAIVSGKAGAIALLQGVGIGAGVALGTIVGAAHADELYGSPFIEKVLRNGVDGLLTSPRKTFVGWDRIISAEYRKLVAGRGRMTIRTTEGEHVLKVLQNTHVAGDPSAVFGYFLSGRFTGPAFR